MEFLKNHYEKVLLSVILLGLAVAVAMLPMKARPPEPPPPPPPPAPLTPVDLSTNVQVLQNLENLDRVELAGSHNLFNPVVWKKTPDGTLIKIDREDVIGPGAIQVTNIQPLRLVLSFEGLNTGTSLDIFRVGVIQETNKNPSLRGRQTVQATLNENKPAFTIRQARPADSPTELVLEIPGKPLPVVVSLDKPYSEVVGYAADLRYPPESKVFRNQRVGDRLVFEDDTNNIVDINANEVVLSDNSGKRTSIKYKAAP